MLRKFIFKENSGYELALPITPPSFTVDHGIRIETVNIHGAGDLNLAGTATLMKITIDCMFRGLPNSAGKGYLYEDPFLYTGYFQNLAYGKIPVRFIVTDTDVNVPVLVENISYGEKDGTNDVYATISLAEYHYLKTESVEGVAGNDTRAVEQTPTHPDSYTVKRGDTLSEICLLFYGDGRPAKYKALAAANGIKNPNLIYVGQVILLPETL